MSTAIDRRIAAALTEPISSSDLQKLISETEVALTEADRNAKAATEEAVDVTVSLDLRAAREKMLEAALVRDRLHKSLPRLQQRLVEVLNAEANERWKASFNLVKAKRDAAAQRFLRYPELAAEMAAILQEAATVGEEVTAVNIASPPGGGHLLGPELVARGLQSFSRDAPSIIEKTVLSSWEPSGKPLWPPPRQFDPALFAPVPYDPRFSWEWWKVAEEKRAIEQQRQQQEAEEAEAGRQQFYGVRPAS